VLPLLFISEEADSLELTVAFFGLPRRTMIAISMTVMMPVVTTSKD
jgi:hypothetical protein